MAKPPEILLEWQAPEYRHYPKNSAWYITSIVIWALFVIYMAVQADWFGAVVVFIVGVLYLLFAQREPEIVNIQLSDQGVHLEDLHIPYSRIRHYWIVDNEHHKVLNFHTTAYINNEFAVQLEDQDVDIVKELLSAVLDEHDETEETLTQRIAHKIKF